MKKQSKTAQNSVLLKLANDLKAGRVSDKEYERVMNQILGMNFQDRTEEVENDDTSTDRDGQIA
jgi:hypothetical protein